MTTTNMPVSYIRNQCWLLYNRLLRFTPDGAARYYIVSLDNMTTPVRGALEEELLEE